jgi:hypothetical protein
MMKNLNLVTLTLFALIFISSCINTSSNEYASIFGYDGEYCAEVEYSNPNTGTNATYQLNVTIEDDYLIEISWPNGGWLDQDHFSSTNIEDGDCFFTSDKGYEYTVTVLGETCSYTDENEIRNQWEEDEEAITCSKCGREKDPYDDYCSRCEQEIEDEEEHTCSRCGGFEYYVYGGLCSNCEDEEENTCSRCGNFEYGVYGGLCSNCEEEDEY